MLGRIHALSILFQRGAPGEPLLRRVRQQCRSQGSRDADRRRRLAHADERAVARRRPLSAGRDSRRPLPDHRLAGQRHKDRQTADEHYSGKKKQNTLKSQVAVEEISGQLVDVADSLPGPTADLKMLEQSGLLNRLPEGMGAIGDLAYIGIDQLHPDGLAAAPRRKPRGKPRPKEDILYNTEFSRRRIIVENSIGRLRRMGWSVARFSSRGRRCKAGECELADEPASWCSATLFLAASDRVAPPTQR